MILLNDRSRQSHRRSGLLQRIQQRPVATVARVDGEQQDPSDMTVLTCSVRTSCPRPNSASELVKKALRPLGCANTFTTPWAVVGTCQEIMTLARSKTAWATVAWYVRV